MFALGAARGAVADVGGVAVEGIDDVEPDLVTGVIRGPIERVSGGERWFLDTTSGRFRVTVRGSSPLLPGDRVRLRGRLRSPGGYRLPDGDGIVEAARWRTIDGRVAVPAEELELIERGRSVWRAPARLHRRLARSIQGRGGSRRGNGLVRAMVLGDRSGLEVDDHDAFRDAGVSHVLAVSGLHLAVVALLFFAVVRRAWAGVPSLTLRVSAPRAAALAAMPVAVAYTMTTGARVSTVRALVVVMVVLVGVVLDRRARLVDALGAAAVIILTFDPLALFDPSFHLSFAATTVLALAMARGPATDRPSRWWRGVSSLARASLWASIATAPFTALWFGTIAPGGLIANLVVVPVVELVVLPLGLCAVVLAQLWPAAGGPLIDAAVVTAAWLGWLVEWMSGWMPVLHVSAPSLAHLAGALAVVAAALCWRRELARPRVALLLAVAGGISVAGASAVEQLRAPPTSLRITFLDVGQGDGAVIELPGGGVWLIDAGGRPFVVAGGSERSRDRAAESPGEHSVARYLWSRRVGHVDRIIISHPHPDHYLGLRALARRISIGEVWLAMPHPETIPPVDLVATLVQLRLAGARVVYPPLGPAPPVRGVTARVLHPWHHLDVAADDPSLGVNDNSLVVSIEFAGRTALFTGDLEEEGEDVLRGRVAELDVDIVKVGHHGSKTSSSDALVRATSPRYAVISCGRANRFGFPDPGVLERWQRIGADVLRTDTSGSVVIEIDAGGEMSVIGRKRRR